MADQERGRIKQPDEDGRPSNLPVVAESAGALALDAPGKQFLHAVLLDPHKTTGSGALQVRMVGLIAQDNPRAIQQAIAAAYYHPEIASPQDKGVDSTLYVIRETYPTVINHFDEHVMVDMLIRFPKLQERVREAQELLHDVSTEEIKTVEIALRTLIQDGNISDFSMDDYFKTITSHAFFTEMAKTLQKERVNPQERKSFRDLGQRLLIKRRLYETNPESADTDYKMIHPTREQEFSARVAQLRMIQNITSTLIAQQADKSTIDNLRESFRSVEELLATQFPVMFLPLRKSLHFPDIGKRDRWEVAPGSEPLPQKEWVSWHNRE